MDTAEKDLGVEGGPKTAWRQGEFMDFSYNIWTLKIESWKSIPVLLAQLSWMFWKNWQLCRTL
jgi:hypothetical protein